MCGINGIISLNNLSPSKEKIEAMNQRIAHRGPDCSGAYADGPIALGHVRLSIIDLSDAGSQPMISEDGNLVLVFNGEIYNYLKLKSQLNYPFKTQTDSEVLFAAWKEWGQNMCEHLEGMFAFVIYDKASQTIFMARDRLGIKPLYYFQSQDYFVFSSEVRGVLESDLVERVLNQELLPEYFTLGSVSGTQTLVKDIQLMEPGTWFTIQNQKITSQTYWKLEHKTDVQIPDYEETKQEVRKLFFESIEKRLVSDVPFGAFLSGGIDSTAVTAVMSHVSSSPVHTFNINFDESEFSEAKFAQLVSEKYQTQHTEIKLNPSVFLEEIDTILKAYDHPGNDGANTYMVSKATKEAGITMALSGLGGDEVFGGYPVFRKHDSLQRKLSKIPAPFRSMIASVLIKNPTIRNKKLTELLSENEITLATIYKSFRKIASETDLKTLLNASYSLPCKSFFSGNKQFRYSEISAAETYFYMQPVLLRDADQMSMAHALEVRVPFLDHKLVDFVHQLPDTYKFNSQYPKSLLVDSLRDLLPDDIIFRKKMGFVLPWEQWMKRELAYLVVNAIQDAEGIINSHAWKHAYQEFCASNKQTNWNLFWSLITLTQWMKHNQIRVS